MRSGDIVQSGVSPAGAQASSIHQLWLLMLWTTTVVCVVVLALIAVAVRRHRRRDEVATIPTTPERSHVRSVWAATTLSLLILLMLLVACASTNRLVDQQQKALTSLKATVTSVCTAWLDGKVSTTYARTALETAGILLEKERATIGGSPDALTDARIASLTESQNQLARQIALLRKALADSDAAAIRRQIATAGSRPRQVP